MRAVRHEFKKVMVVYQQGLLISPQIKIPILPGTETGQYDACVNILTLQHPPRVMKTSLKVRAQLILTIAHTKRRWTY